MPGMYLVDQEGNPIKSDNPIPAIAVYREIDYIIPLFDTLAWSGFTNQPTNDDVQVISNNAGDTGIITLFGVDNADAFKTHTITLTGTTAADSVLNPKWKTIYGAFMGDVYGKNIAAAVGTITLREKSGGAAITTIAATKISTGLVGFALQGRDVTVVGVSGNLYLYDNGAASVTNGYPFDSAEKFNFIPVGDLFTLISDTSAATSKIVVWK